MNLTTQQAAERLGISVRRVQALIAAGRLKATRFGKSLAIQERDLKAVEIRKPGAPKGSRNASRAYAEIAQERG